MMKCVEDRYDMDEQKCSEISFFNNLKECQMAKMFAMCCELDAGGGSIRYTYEAHSNAILHSYVTVCTTLIHQVKMRLPIKKQLPSNIQGKIAYYFCVFIVILNCHRLQTKAQSD